jgi:L-asparaginase II
MTNSPYQPVYQYSRGGHPESLHYGAVAVVDSGGLLVAWHGDPEADPFLRSSAKPFQALPLLLAGGLEHYGLSDQELALICASHSGTDEHVAVLAGLHARLGIGEANLQCGVHPPFHKPTADSLRAAGLAPTPARHNCSGKHSGMLALAALKGWPLDSYLEPDHPTQVAILEATARLCGMDKVDIAVGTDGCSAPNFALPLHNSAWGFARLMDQYDLPEDYAVAARQVRDAMLAYPGMVAGPERLDTAIMQWGGGRILSKGGAEGYQAFGLAAGALGPGSPALGVALKIADGDARKAVRDAVAVEVLRQLGLDDVDNLSNFGPQLPVHNWRGLEVGRGEPVFQLELERRGG